MEEDTDMKFTEADAMPVRGDPILINPFAQEEIGNAESEVAALYTEIAASPEFEDNDFVNQLNKAFTESSLRDLPPVHEDSTATSLDVEDVEDLVAGITELSLRLSTYRRPTVKE